MIDGRQLSGLGSLGVVSYPEHGMTIDELLRHADAAIYREKKRRQPVPPETAREDHLPA